MLIVASALTLAALVYVVRQVLKFRRLPYGAVVTVNRAEAARLRESRRASTRTTV